MPYKNPEDKKKWTKRNRDKTKLYAERHFVKYSGCSRLTKEELAEKYEKMTVKTLQERQLKKDKKANQLKDKLLSKTKICVHCEQNQAKDNFQGRSSGSLDGKRGACRVCDRARYKAYRKTDRYKELRSTPIRKAASVSWGVRKREAVYSIHSVITRELVLEIHKRFNYKCFACLALDDLTIDHHMPIHKGHALTKQNAVVLCRSCNSLKAKQEPTQFYTRQQLTTLRVTHGII